MLDNHGSSTFFSDSMTLFNPPMSAIEVSTNFFHDRVNEGWNYVLLYRGSSLGPRTFRGYWVEYRPCCPYKEGCEPNSIIKHDVVENRKLSIDKIMS